MCYYTGTGLYFCPCGGFNCRCMHEAGHTRPALTLHPVRMYPFLASIR